MPIVESFAPIIGRQPEILILGSMPGEASLTAHQYYAHPRNQFWPILGNLTGLPLVELPYQERVKALEDFPIVLWDVLRQCERSGSLDTAINTSSMVPNDFAELFTKYPGLTNVAFNGTLAATTFRRRVQPMLPTTSPVAYHRLPSTSPAHAAMSLTEKTVAWGEVLRRWLCPPSSAPLNP